MNNAGPTQSAKQQRTLGCLLGWALPHPSKVEQHQVATAVRWQSLGESNPSSQIENLVS